MNATWKSITFRLCCFLAVLVCCLLPQVVPAGESVQSIYNRANKLASTNRHYEAAQLYEKAGEFGLQEAAPRYTFLGMLFQQAGFSYYKSQQYKTALSCYEKSADAFRKGGMEPSHLTNMIAQVQMEMNENVGATNSFKERIAEIRTSDPCDEETLRYILDLAAGQFFKQGKYLEAEEFLEANLKIDREIGNFYSAAVSSKNLGRSASYQKNYGKAMRYFTEALAFAKKMTSVEEVKKNLSRRQLPHNLARQIGEVREYELWRITGEMGKLLYLQGEYGKAAEYLQKYIRSREKMLASLLENSKRAWDVFSQDLNYQYLVSSLIRSNDLQGAFKIVEKNHARQLRARLAARYRWKDDVISLRELQSYLSLDTAVLLFSNVAGELPIAQLTITHDSIFAREIPTSDLLTPAVNKYRGDIEKYIKSNQFTEKLRDEKIYFEDVINYFVSLLNTPELKRSIKSIERPVAGTNGRNDVDRILYDSLIKPIAPQLEGKTRLIIIPEGFLGLIPFETLVDDAQHFLVEKYDISYGHSMSILKALKQREYEKGRGLLAFGGAVYETVEEQHTDGLETGDWQELLDEVQNTVNRTNSLRGAYTSFGYSWGNLPGTLAEVRSIEKAVDGVELVVGSQVTEKRVKEMSESGQLKKFGVIHFATHGLSVAFAPELSSVVLSQLKKEDENDGYLAMHEITKLDLQADFVNLSACETGLGRIYGGEGVVGLSQAFLLAGANGLSVSLWKIGDESTSKFMVALYLLAQKEGVPYWRAMNECKRKFIRGDFGEKLKNPFYWAPFVYYGL